MKKKLFYLVVLTMLTVLILPACTNEKTFMNKEEGFPEISETALDKTATITKLNNSLFDFEKVFNGSEYTQWYDDEYRSIFECFNSLDEIKKSDYVAYIDELSDIDWNKQTLVIVRAFCRQVIKFNYCKAYCQSGKYTIDINFNHLILNALGEFGVAIILSKGDVQKRDIKLNLTIAND